MGEVFGWFGLVLGQVAAWPQVLKLRRASGRGISLLSYGLWIGSMSLYLAHAISIDDTVMTVAIPVALVPNTLITVILVRRWIVSRRRADHPPATASEGGVRKVGARSVHRPRRLQPEGTHLLADRAGSTLEQVLPQKLAGPTKLRFDGVDRRSE